MIKDNVKEEIIKLYQEGLGSPSIAKKLRIGKSTVLSLLHKEGILDNSRKNGYSFNRMVETPDGVLCKDNKEDWVKYHKMHMEGATYDSLAERLNISKHIIFDIFRKFEFETVSKEEARRRSVKARLVNKKPIVRKKPIPKSPERIRLENNEEIIRDLYLNKKYSGSRLSKLFGISSDVILKYLYDLGIKRGYEESMQIFSEYSNNYTNINFFDSIDTEEKAYWLGFIYADGNINKSGNLLTIGLKDTDEDHLKKFSDIFGKTLEKHRLKKYGNIKSERVVVYCRISNKYLCSKLIEKGIKPRKTYTNSNDVMNHIPEHLFRHFLRGLFDGDGCFSTNRFTFLTNNKLLSEIRDILVKDINISYNKIRENMYYSTIQYGSKEDCRKLYEYLYKDSNIYLCRKKIKLDKFIIDAV